MTGRFKLGHEVVRFVARNTRRQMHEMVRGTRASGVSAKMIRHYEEMQAMRRALLDLARHCHGDRRPDCPIIDDLAGEARP
jgi:hypothetical protein